MSHLYQTSTMLPERLPPYVQDSWKRCQSKGLQPTDIQRDNRLSHYEMVQQHDEFAELLYYSSPILDDVYYTIHGTQSLLLLAAPNGTILHAIGEPSFLRQADKVALSQGANWLEEMKGTNAIGTAIVEQKPLIVHGTHHFLEDNHFLTCAAAPIFNADGQLLGILNISSHRQNYHPFSLGLVQRTVQCIEQSLLLGLVSRKIKNSATDNKIYTRPVPSIEEKWDDRSRDRNRRKTGTNGAAGHYSFADIIAEDPAVKEKITLAKRAAALDISLLILGESGTGKELFAQSIHEASPRRDKPFLAINCSAIPDSLLESELFGYEKGAFTGAKSGGQLGKFEAAHGGTLFLDEIGDMPLQAQAALLRVLQERCVTRVGGTLARPVDVRIIAATHKDLVKEIEAGRFRADLYFRLNGFTLKLPALRERSDILALAEHILQTISFAKEVPYLTDEAQSFIEQYEWPGNFRQLQNVLQQAAFLAVNHSIGSNLLHSLCPTLHFIQENKPENPWENTRVDRISLRETEQKAIREVLEKTKWNITRAAKLLNIGRNTLYRKIKSYNLSP
ncbi:sigma-54-dependent Fis family transcriptional regulator [Aneurinibacillus terranovensis]|uniref:sigma-54-dependent Fis family transcriptional regulator n=1 Tax=Aneurinibacillus terranovensis TaxID=278991 RepID=UPI000426A7D6|nr:sigma-54-dependent Fis family transcriptional regulator [Aneurinibacillus terranovensis]